MTSIHSFLKRTALSPQHRVWRWEGTTPRPDWAILVGLTLPTELVPLHLLSLLGSELEQSDPSKCQTHALCEGKVGSLMVASANSGHATRRRPQMHRENMQRPKHLRRELALPQNGARQPRQPARAQPQYRWQKGCRHTAPVDTVQPLVRPFQGRINSDNR